MKAPKNNLCRAASFELRATEDTDDGFTLEGYAAVFDTPTRIDSWEGRFDETITRGAFAKTIKERKPVLQFDHGHDSRTGSVPIGAIDELREDDHGLFVRARLHDNDLVKPIRDAIASGAIDGMSFRFRVLREEWDESSEVPQRSIREVELFELGPVVFPAYEATSVGVRSMLAGLDDDARARLVTEIADEMRGDPAVVRPGDGVVISVPLHTTPEQAQAIKRTWEQQHPDVAISVVAADGVTIVRSTDSRSDAADTSTSDDLSDAGSPATSESPNNHADLRFALERWAASHRKDAA